MGAVIDLTQEMYMDREEFRGRLHEVADWAVDEMDDSDFQKRYTRKTAQRLVGYSGAVLPVLAVKREAKTMAAVPYVFGAEAVVSGRILMGKFYKGEAQSHG